MESTYNLRNVVAWLLDQEYGHLINGEFVITNKLNRDLRPGGGVSIITPTLQLTKKDTWNRFILDAEIPHRVTSSIGTYTVRQFNAVAVNKLISILRDSEVDNEKFIASTKNYYKSVTGRTTLSKYLTSDLWRDDYNEWIKNPIAIVNDGSSRWED